MTDTIEQFFANTEAARAAAVEYARRAEKGLPCDRWTSGSEGAQMVADGIRAWVRLAGMNAAALEWYLQQERERGSEAMATSADPMRDDA